MIEEAMDTHYEAINWALGKFIILGAAMAPSAPSFCRRQADLKQWHAWLEAQLGNAPWLAGTASPGPTLPYCPTSWAAKPSASGRRQKVGWALIWRGARRGPAFRRGGRKLQP